MTKITFLVTREPATGRIMCCPACEQYHTPEQTLRNVLRREYQSGIMTYLDTREASYAALGRLRMSPLGDIF
jgi:hypothetical protein